MALEAKMRQFAGSPNVQRAMSCIWWRVSDVFVICLHSLHNKAVLKKILPLLHFHYKFRVNASEAHRQIYKTYGDEIRCIRTAQGCFMTFREK
ncbi:hypothetical protein KIN20_004745 [Parelaphostrongylus tenuis]|uniref:Mos1 transposase HTH domain-containing protein n=1 Tax=Parelaphostrongylus tenuis TaxID=148309 RepID=A0AAD5LZ02_PARTN|nr:hypothetical protein KIN20_004745 [Parelaphostrongylus tenuis]